MRHQRIRVRRVHPSLPEVGRGHVQPRLHRVLRQHEVGDLDWVAAVLLETGLGEVEGTEEAILDLLGDLGPSVWVPVVLEVPAPVAVAFAIVYMAFVMQVAFVM